MFATALSVGMAMFLVGVYVGYRIGKPVQVPKDMRDVQHFSVYTTKDKETYICGGVK